MLRHYIHMHYIEFKLKKVSYAEVQLPLSKRRTTDLNVIIYLTWVKFIMVQSGEISGEGKLHERLISGMPNVFGVIKQMHLLSKLLEVVISIFRYISYIEGINK